MVEFIKANSSVNRTSARSKAKYFQVKSEQWNIFSPKCSNDDNFEMETLISVVLS